MDGEKSDNNKIRRNKTVFLATMILLSLASLIIASSLVSTLEQPPLPDVNADEMEEDIPSITSTTIDSEEVGEELDPEQEYDSEGNDKRDDDEGLKEDQGLKEKSRNFTSLIIIGVIVIIISLSSLAGYQIYEHKKHREEAQKEYVERCRLSGYDDQVIRKSLLQAGYPQDKVDELLRIEIGKI